AAARTYIRAAAEAVRLGSRPRPLMPYEWTETAPDDSGAVFYRLTARPHRSLPRRGFVWFIAVTAMLMLLPIVAVLGTSALWGLLPFALLAIWGIWTALQKTYRSGEIREVLELSRDRLSLTRHDPDRPPRHWRVNSYWVRAAIRKGPVEQY